MKWRRILVAVIGTTLSISALTARAAVEHCPPIGVFSTLGFDPNTGDFSGTEVTVMVAATGDYIIYTYASGGLPDKPLVVNAIISGNSLKFAVGSGEGSTISYDLTISCKGLRGHLHNSIWSPGEWNPVFLPRTKSFWDNSDKVTH
jgi:hypothetical protein